jgi:(R,R)-butanediol dehydrogenase/meso-butanediol dehydrogenase/diacetyl reductase
LKEGNKMRAAVFYGKKDIRIEKVADPVPGVGELLLRVSAVGICGTDAHEFSTGPHMFPIPHKNARSGHVGPMIPGHEIAGVVESIGSQVGDFIVGELVVSGAGISCGLCHWCHIGRTNLCQNYYSVGLERNGGLAEFVVVPAKTCISATHYGLKPDAAALGQPMSIAVHATRRGRLISNEIAVIIGAGGIGAFMTYVVSQFGATLVVSDLDLERLNIASNLGATYTVLPESENSLGELLRDRGLVPSVIYEVTGSSQGLKQALAIAPRGCRIVLVGLHSQPYELDVRDISLREIEIIGTNAHIVATDLPEALRLLAIREEGWGDIAPTALTLDELVTEGIVPLSEHRSTRIKTLIDPWASQIRPTNT